MTDLLIPTDFEEALTITGERVSLTVGAYSPNLGQRRAWHYYSTVDGIVVCEGNDLSGFGSAEVIMESLTSFLSAWAEAVEYLERTGEANTENSDLFLFPTDLFPIIRAEVETLAMIGMHLIA